MILVFVFFILYINTISSVPINIPVFTKFICDYNKNYKNDREYHYRYSIFHDNIKNNGEINTFSDMTIEEYYYMYSFFFNWHCDNLRCYDIINWINNFALIYPCCII